MKRLACKLTAGMLSAGMAMSLIPCVAGNVTVMADTGKNQENTCLGTSEIAKPVKPKNKDEVWTGSYVFFGNDEGEALRFRVLDPDTTKYGGNTMLLDSDECLYTTRYNDIKSGNWENSELRYYLNNGFRDDYLTGREARALAISVLDGGTVYPYDSFERYMYGKTVGLTGDYVFVLDVDEILNENYGYASDTGAVQLGEWSDNDYEDTTVENHAKFLGDDYAYYWLRSSFNADNEKAGIVCYDGGLGVGLATNGEDYAVAPALNISKDMVMFSTLVFGDMNKPDAGYKLTLFDKDLKVKTSDNEKVVCIGDKVTVPYAIYGGNAVLINRVSVLILDKKYQEDADILYYGELDGYFEITTATDSSDYMNHGTFTLPSGLDLNGWGKDYYVYILPEEVNGTYYSDYAGTPVMVDAPDSSQISGWIKSGYDWYYYVDGAKTTGWKNIEGKWYLFASSGVMTRNWQFYDTSWYYLGNDGAMRTRWQKINGEWYYLGGDGAMRTGWQYINGEYYFLKYSSGAMAANEYWEGYWLSSDGVWRYKYRATWRKDSHGWWYGDDSGWYAKNETLKINGKSYSFDSEGYWIE